MEAREKEYILALSSDFRESKSCQNAVKRVEIECRSHITTGNVAGTSVIGLTVLTSTILIVAEIGGAGVLALPYSLSKAGWIGLVIMVFVGLVSIYTGGILGKSWLIIQQRYPTYQSDMRYPYPAMGYVTFGTKGRIVISLAVNLTLFGASVVYLIMSAENIQSLLHRFIDVSFCYWLIVVAVILIPLSFLGTPKDFWYFAAIALIATIISCIILVITVILDSPRNNNPQRKDTSFHSLSQSFGMMLFAFGGHSVFPTIVTDMKEQHKFHHSVALAYACILLLYIPVSAVGYFVYGSDVNENILLSLPRGAPQIIVEILFTFHLLFAYNIIINPVCQEFESLINIPREFTWKRIATRCLVVLTCLFVAEAVPHFGSILALVGGTTSNLLAYIAPPLMYIKLSYMEGNWQKIDIPLHIKVLNIEIIAIGILGGVAGTYWAILSIVHPAACYKTCLFNSSCH